MKTFDVWITIEHLGAKISYSVGTTKVYENKVDSVTAKKSDFINFKINLIKTKQNDFYHILERLQTVNNKCEIELISYDSNQNEDIKYKVKGKILDYLLLKNNKCVLTLFLDRITKEVFFNREVKDATNSN
jgi:hypothetical protein